MFLEQQKIFPGVVGHRDLPKYSIFHVDLVHMLPRRQSSILRNISASTAAEIFHFMCINCTYYTEGKPIFSEIFRHQQAPRYSVFMCIDCAYYTKGRTIFSEIYRHQLPLKYFTFTSIQCTCSTSHRQYSLEYFGTETCRNIPHQQLPKYSIFMCISCSYYTEGKPIFSEIFRH